VAVKVLLDTNAYSALMADRGRVADIVRRADAVLLSAVVLGELLFGFRNGTRYNENRTQLEAFLSRRFVRIIEVTLETAERFGLVAAQLRRRGTPIPTNDVWIAAHAMESGGHLLSFDRHFEEVEGLLWSHLGGE
jgi:predicted nucleic acid-binding protein